MMNTMKRFALVLCLVALCVSLLGVSVLAVSYDPVTTTIPVEIALSGYLPEVPDTFKIQVSADDPTFPMPEGAADGKYVMDMMGNATADFSITFDKHGVYTYTVEQLNIGNGGLESLTSFGGMVSGEKVGTPEILFARLDPVKKMEEINAVNEAKNGKPAEAPKAEEKKAEKKEEKKPEKKHEEPTYPEVIDIDTFFQSKIQVGRVLECTNVPKSKKLLQFRLSFGKDGERTILSGIAQYYPNPEELVGKQIVAITNLAPRKMMGIESHGMILSAVDDEGNLRLASVGEGVADGALLG